MYNSLVTSHVVWLQCVALIIFASFSVQCDATEFTEESLILKTSNEDQLYAVFNFSTVSTDLALFEGHHYNLIPRSVGELLQKYNVAEFHLSMTQGLWRYERWGYPYFPAPPGAQLWVWFHPNTESVDANWYGFTNALSGLLCASLNFIGKTETVTPPLTFRPEGAVFDDSSKYLRQAVLSRENLCTENLTPWLKLLPCGSNSGISSLINPATLHHSQYLSLGLNFKRICLESECESTAINLHQSVSAVFDIRTSTKQKPDHGVNTNRYVFVNLFELMDAYSFVIPGRRKASNEAYTWRTMPSCPVTIKVEDFTVEKILKKKMKGACPLARSSVIKIAVPQHVELHPEPDRKDDGFQVYDLIKQSSLRDIRLHWKTVLPADQKTLPILVGHCHLAGIGHQDGGIRCRISNTEDRNITVIIMQTIPWFLQVYLHTLEIKDQSGRILHPERLTFRPAKIRQSPYFLEYMLNIPGTSTAEISMQFTRGFLTWTEHPPDANHGFYISSTVISVRKKDIGIDSSSDVHRIYSEALKVIIPVPDFSMPYNVICLACTVLAIAFGSFHNLTTRRYKKMDPDKPDEGPLQKIISIPKKLLARLKKGKDTKETKEAVND